MALLCVASLADAAPPASSPDLVITGGQIFTSTGGAMARAVAITGDRIVFVGTDADAKASTGSARRVDLHGAFVMPGIFDAHNNPGLVSILGSGDWQKDQASALPATSKADLLAALRQHAKSNPNERLVACAAGAWCSIFPTGRTRGSWTVFGRRRR